MRFFLSSFLDQTTQQYLRDCLRRLNKHQRNLELVDLVELHCNWKFLGEDLHPELVRELTTELREWVSTSGLSAFAHAAERVDVGKRGELVPEKIKLELVHDKDLKQFHRLLHLQVLKVAGDEVVRRKDNEWLLGIFKVGAIRRNTSPQQRRQIIDEIRQFPAPPAVSIDNLEIISTQVARNKVAIKRWGKIPLLES
jgi:hypothetical protein